MIILWNTACSSNFQLKIAFNLDANVTTNKFIKNSNLKYFCAAYNFSMKT